MKNKSFANIIAKFLTIFFMTFMILYCISLIFPIVWMFLNALKSNADFIDYSTLSLPQSGWHFENFIDIFSIIEYKVETSQYSITFKIWDMLNYSLQYSIGTAIYSCITLTITAYACGRYKFWLTKLLYTIGVFIMIIPFVTDGGASLLLKKQLGIYDNLWAWILTSGGCIFTGQFFFIMTEFFSGLGSEYAEAAQIDGASEFTIMLKIMVPLATPLMVVILVLAFITAWNNYGVFLYYLPSYANLALGMYSFQNLAPIRGYTTPQVLSGFVVIAVPIVIMYLSTQKIIARNMQIGGLKG